MDDSRFVWVVLVPRTEDDADVTELHHLDVKDRMTLMEEITNLTSVIDEAFSPDNINVVSKGNLVPQLAFHVIARNADDDAWPGSVWDSGDRQPYEADNRDNMIDHLRSLFAGADMRRA